MGAHKAALSASGGVLCAIALRVAHEWVHVALPGSSHSAS